MRPVQNEGILDCITAACCKLSEVLCIVRPTHWFWLGYILNPVESHLSHGTECQARSQHIISLQKPLYSFLHARDFEEPSGLHIRCNILAHRHYKHSPAQLKFMPVHIPSQTVIKYCGKQSYSKFNMHVQVDDSKNNFGLKNPVQDIYLRTTLLTSPGDAGTLTEPLSAHQMCCGMWLSWSLYRRPTCPSFRPRTTATCLNSRVSGFFAAPHARHTH